MPVEFYKNEELTQAKGLVVDGFHKKGTYYNYDGTGFKITVSPEKMGINENCYGENFILVEFENGVCSGNLFLNNISNKERRKSEWYNILTDNQENIQLSFDHLKTLKFTVSKDSYFADSYKVENDNFTVFLDRPAQSVFAFTGNNERVKFERVGEKEYSANIGLFKVSKEYSLRAQDDDVINLILKSKSVIESKDLGNKVVLIRSNKTHNLKLTVENVISNIKQVSEENNIVEIKTTASGNIGDYENVENVRICFFDEFSQKNYILSTGK
ncbi:MAG: hypothetical protein LIO62_02880, partial [Clostridiales bacterium]|nr:hypothetical protein [Clostridiales bacterium]